MEKREARKIEQLDAWTLLEMVWRWKWVLLVVACIAGGTAFGISKVLDPLYESHAVLLPGSSSSRDKLLEEFRYGYEAESERLIQLLYSESILDSLETRFGLAEAWEISHDSEKWYDDFVGMARERIQFHKTRHSSVVVSVIDEVPERAAAIANEACRLVNIVNANIVKATAMEVLTSVEREFMSHSAQVQTIHDTIRNVQSQNSVEAVARLKEDIRATERKITVLRDSISEMRQRHNIFDYGYQVNVLNKELAKAHSMLLQESGALEVIPPENSGKDTLRLRSEARKRGAQRRVEYFEQQLGDLGAVNGRYAGSLEKLDIEIAHLATTNEELDKLQRSIEPLVSSRGLDRLETELDFDQFRLNELHAKYETALSNYYNPPLVAHKVSPARPSYVKVFPKTLLSMVFAVVGCVLAAIVGIAVLEYFQGRKTA